METPKKQGNRWDTREFWLAYLAVSIFCFGMSFFGPTEHRLYWRVSSSLLGVFAIYWYCRDGSK